MTEPLYKVLDLDGTAHNGGRGQWMLPANGQPGAWMPPIVGDLIPCQHGYHLCRRGDLIHWLGPTLWVAEARWDQIVHTDKVVVRQARLLHRIETWTERTARLFACECAERALKRERAAGREPAEASWQSITVARRFASGTATVEELSAARAAASAAAWDAERDWQTERLFQILEGDLPAVKVTP